MNLLALIMSGSNSALIVFPPAVAALHFVWAPVFVFLLIVYLVGPPSHTVPIILHVEQCWGLFDTTVNYITNCRLNS